MRAIAIVGVVALGLAAGARRVKAECPSSVGHEQCEQHPSCTCSYEVLDCDKGGWTINYFVVQPCDTMTPPAPPPQPTGDHTPYVRRPTTTTTSSSPVRGGDSSRPVRPPQRPPQPPRIKPPDNPCGAMMDLRARYSEFLRGLLDDAKLNMATNSGWSQEQYDSSLWNEPHAPSSPVMETIPQGCIIKDNGCDAWAKDHHLPDAFCKIARAHEEVHQRQCKAAGGRWGTTLRDHRDREVEALRDTLKRLEEWIDKNCRLV